MLCEFPNSQLFAPHIQQLNEKDWHTFNERPFGDWEISNNGIPFPEAFAEGDTDGDLHYMTCYMDGYGPLRQLRALRCSNFRRHHQPLATRPLDRKRPRPPQPPPAYACCINFLNGEYARSIAKLWTPYVSGYLRGLVWADSNRAVIVCYSNITNRHRKMEELAVPKQKKKANACATVFAASLFNLNVGKKGQETLPQRI